MKQVKCQFADGGRSKVKKDFRDSNACTVNALANTTGMPYDVAHVICAASGRPPGKGWHPSLILLHAKKYGVKSKTVLRSRQTLQKFIEKHPVGSFYVATSRHAFAVVDGVVMDWQASGPKTRLTEGYKIEGTYNGRTIKKLRGAKALAKYIG